MAWFFAFFVLSGFCGLVYQVVWLRIAMADFGVTTPSVSIVLSVFMAGLALGSWGAGRLTRRMGGRPPATFLRVYAGIELAIGFSGLVVAPCLGWGRTLLASAGEQASWNSASYYLASGAWVTLILLPFCTCMGATFPLAMAGIRSAFHEGSERSFSYLYVANVLGAMAGALVSAFVLIEILGFRRTMLVAAALNAVVAILALLLSSRLAPAQAARAAIPTAGKKTGRRAGEQLAFEFLFVTGLVSLALEVVWTRQFVPFQGPLVYAFATILAVYLAATVAGSRIYRAWARAHEGREISWHGIALLAGTVALLGLLAADPRLPLSRGVFPGALRVVLGLAPFCGVLGFLTPMLVDRISRGDPDLAGTAYAVNTVGCILGPLLSGFVLLPWIGERATTALLALPILAFAVFGMSGPGSRQRGPSLSPRRVARLAVAVAASAALVALTRDQATLYPKRIVKRDHTATVIATGEGMRKRLIVNGVGMTMLTPITKMMSHLPLAFLEQPPAKGLVLCLGMGTSFRSMLSWGIPTTVVELVPSIPSLLGFYQADGEKIRRSPLARIVVDDARRFLERSRESFDVIVIDPPPPVEAAGSSLLYSAEFYELARKRLKPGGILQQWLPEGEPIVISAVARALADRFPYVRVFQSVERWGFHFLASGRPIPSRTPAELSARLPSPAAADVVEWGPNWDSVSQFQAVASAEIPLRALMNLDPAAPVLSDDRPVNEYYFLRRVTGPSAVSSYR